MSKMARSELHPRRSSIGPVWAWLGCSRTPSKMLAERVCATCCLLHMFGALCIMQAWPVLTLEVGLWHSCPCIMGAGVQWYSCWHISGFGSAHSSGGQCPKTIQWAMWHSVMHHAGGDLRTGGQLKTPGAAHRENSAVEGAKLFMLVSCHGITFLLAGGVAVPLWPPWHPSHDWAEP